MMRTAFFTVLPVALFLGLSGCGEPTVEEKMAQIKTQYDGMRRCGNLVDANWPIEFRRREADPLHGYNTLVAAGLFRFEPIKDRAEGNNLNEFHDDTRALPTPFGSPDIFILSFPGYQKKYVQLCYGTIQVISVTMRDDNPNPKIARFDVKFRIVNPRSWTSHADIRQAHPDMVRDLNEVHTEKNRDGQILSEGPVSFR
jgi:hypothetical protein